MDKDNKEKKEQLIQKIKSKPCFKSNLEIYGDKDKQLAFMWSPRGGCSITLKCFLDMLQTKGFIEPKGSKRDFKGGFFLG
jgi:hypothetical protein